MSAVTATTTPSTPSAKSQTDPNALLDAIDAYTTNTSIQTPQKPTTNNNNNNNNTPTKTTPSQQPPPQTFDPITFLNNHYATESSLVSHLPTLLSSITTRIDTHNQSISNAIQRQAERGDKTATDVYRAKSSITSLHSKIQLIQNRAATSEQTVLDITRDMKKLDHAKKHLQQTITALKRLHMLIYAVDQLSGCVKERPLPRFREASHLFMATQELLGHFELYSGIPQIKDIKVRVSGEKECVGRFIYRAFCLDDFMEDSTVVVGVGVGDKGRAGAVGLTSSTSKNNLLSNNTTPNEDKPMDTAPNDTTTNKNDTNDNNNDDMMEESTTIPPMSKTSLSEACLVIAALGKQSRNAFISAFCKSQLKTYHQIFLPKPSQTTTISPLAASALMKRKSGLGLSKLEDGSSAQATTNDDPTSLDQVERRFAWFRRLMRSVDDGFEGVFPPGWKVHYELTVLFLFQTREHMLSLLKSGPQKDPDSENVTILLKALQKSMLFEREMTAWLNRDYGILFSPLRSSSKDGNSNGIASSDKNSAGGEEEEALEFDEEGKSVAANSAEGIRIKYVRQLKQKKEGKHPPKATSTATTPTKLGGASDETDKDDELETPMPSLLAKASGAFDLFMGPYISLEKENMDEQLKEASSDVTVDSRGELPVFTSSTKLFVYMKNSITRCTVLTRGRTFFQLYTAFCESLKSYAGVLAKKFPPPISSSISGITSLAVGVGAQNPASGAPGPTYRIPPGEEVTICHVIDTCEYCAETVETLQDHIHDKIEFEYKHQIDMTNESEAFHDVTARGLRVLVSGLKTRTDVAFREMSGINWASMNVVGEESNYVHKMHDAIQPFVETVHELLPSIYFRNFCDKFAVLFISSYYEAVIRQKRVSESGTQQLLLDVYNLKTLLLKLPNMKKGGPSSSSSSSSITAAPAMYTKTVTSEFARIEMLLKLVGTPPVLLIDVFKSNWPNGSAADLQTVMNLKGMKRNDQQSMLEKLGLEHQSGAAPAASINEQIDFLSERSSDVAAKVNSDLTQMRQKVDAFRMSFR